MCGRFTLTCGDREALTAALGVPDEQLPEAEHRPRYNIAPTDSHWVLQMKLEDRELLPAKWGLVNRWAKDATRAVRQINGRAEGLAKTPAYRDAFQKRRCAVPADGFFEWVGQKDARKPIWFHRPDTGLFFFAGLYESWGGTRSRRRRRRRDQTRHLTGDERCRRSPRLRHSRHARVASPQCSMASR